jgi:ubiquinone/menaquinone biosynthesis C-methylase UbiE
MPFDHFGLIAGLYNRMGSYSPSARFLELLDLHPDVKLLDAGGGTGRVALALQPMVREVVVMDLSRGMLRFAAGKDLGTICAPAENLPFGSSVFDRIIMMDAFHHVINQRTVIHEFWRVLVPGGKIIIVEPDITRFPVKLIALGEKFLFMRSHFFSADKISALLENPHARIRVISDELSILVCAERVREM